MDNGKQAKDDMEIRRSAAKKIADCLETELEVRARLGGICRQTIYTMIREGRFPAPMYIGSRKYWRSSVTSAWLEQQQPMTERTAA